MSNIHRISPLDNVAVSLEENGSVRKGHKIALTDIKKGEYVYKYGHIIGVAKEDIKQGDWVHTHNLSSHLNEDFEYSYNPSLVKLPSLKGTFMGYKRKKGNAGIRNDILIIPTVGCVNGVCKEIERQAQTYKTGSIDGIFALTHQFGCSQLGEDQDNIARLLSSLALNPNASFVLFVGLGCENNSISIIEELLKPYDRDNIAFMTCQKENDEVKAGLEIIKGFANKAKDLRREEVSTNELTIGLKCGGSDSYSGLTANPTVGKVADKVIAMGGSAILTEVPEMFGAEQILMNKCVSKDVFVKYRDLIVSFKKHYTDLGFPVYENPSPGNKEGGISTLEEKSLGCITKAGTSPVNDVLSYGETIKSKGLNVLDGPGNDLVASTALAASGCQVILFTTGRGTPFSTVVPTLKIASNDDLALRKPNWIDFSAFSLDDDGLFSLLIKTCGGEYKTKQEDSHEISFFKKGVTL